MKKSLIMLPKSLFTLMPTEKLFKLSIVYEKVCLGVKYHYGFKSYASFNKCVSKIDTLYVHTYVYT